MADPAPSDNTPLPKGWPKYVKSAMLHVIALAQLSLTYSRSWAADSPLARARLKSALDEAKSEIAMLFEEMRIKDARLARISPHERPLYPPAERLAILELRAARGWTAAETARRMLVTDKTVAAWMRRVDEQGPAALVQIAEPVNRFPDFVRHVVAYLKQCCPNAVKRRIAQVLARAGLHLAVTTVMRMLRSPPPEAPPPKAQPVRSKSKPVTARGPNDVWQIDLTLLPRVTGLWVPWIPFTNQQGYPFAWWVAAVVDHFSRRVMGWCVFPKLPASEEIRALLIQVMDAARAVPRYIISDLGVQFTCEDYKDWCERRGIRPRYAAAASIRATAIIERFFRTLKTELTSLAGSSLTKKALQEKLAWYFWWFEEHRPHQGLGGRTPREVFNGLAPGNEAPRFEPRPSWPRRSGCARPLARPKPRREAGGELAIEVEFLDDERLLPVVTLRRVA